MGKRKENAKEKREKALAKKQSIYQQKERERQEEAARLLEKERQEKEKKQIDEIIHSLCINEKDLNRNKKSTAKAAGLKSTFVLSEEKLLMTSFGAGNSALYEKYIDNGVITDASEHSVLEVQAAEHQFNIKGRLPEIVQVDNPLYAKSEQKSKPGQDMIYCKDKLERIYFNKTFCDNIHIQLIYNILDIEKILAIYINNVVYTLNNLRRQPGEEHDDFIGYMSLNCAYPEYQSSQDAKTKESYTIFKELINKPQMAYFGRTFLSYDDKGKKLQGKALQQHEEKCYYLICLLGMMRQAMAHGGKKVRENIFNLEESLDRGKGQTQRSRAREVLDSVYSEKVRDLNEHFLDHAKKDLYILIKITNADTSESREKLINEYYKFVVLKNYKYLGFSIKHLRECMIKQDPNQRIADKIYDTVRQKLNRILDFLIYRYYQKEENTNRALEMVNQLRLAKSNYEKEYVYVKESRVVWNALENIIFNDVLPKMNGDYIKDIQAEDFDIEMIKNVKITEDATTFSKLIYLLTLFLDGKEINDLLTQLVSKFDNIAGFIDVLQHENLYCKFNDKYKLLECSVQISKELKIINSFARMTEPEPVAKKIMFIEAAELLGYNESPDKLEAYIDQMLTTGKGENQQGKNQKSFRNFIINNVIESDRFKYLVRYGNPSKIKKFAQNKNVISFVLKSIPDKQVCAYYNSCNNTKKDYFDEMRDNLADKILNLQFTDFENVYTRHTKDVDKILDKERKKNIVRLYLTVLYLVQKNLINVNSRYFLAFHCVERDAIVYSNMDVQNLKKDWSSFAAAFLKEHPLNRRAQAYMKINFEHSNWWAMNAFRNCTAHLNAVRNADAYINDIGKFDSYFELYHYLVQRSIIDQFEYDSHHKSKKSDKNIITKEEVDPDQKLERYFNLVLRHHSYCKDLVKALNVPFAYNLARYKNLSINELFDRNNYLPNKESTIKLESNE